MSVDAHTKNINKISSSRNVSTLLKNKNLDPVKRDFGNSSIKISGRDQKVANKDASNLNQT